MSALPAFDDAVAGTADAEQLSRLPALMPFSPLAFDFIAAFSRALRERPEVRQMPELAALAFWMRRANLTRMVDQFRSSANGACFQPRGTAFHIAPSNVDSMFVYSWFLSVLCGNRNIIRLPSRDTPALGLMTDVLAELFAVEDWRAIAQRSMLVRYLRDDVGSTSRYSSLCDLRVIWGGDATVSAIRSIPLPPHACEVAFANKFSIGLIEADGWNHAEAKRQQDWLRRFCNDAYTFGQMACSSPRLLVWHGDPKAVAAAQQGFWSGLSQLLQQRDTRLQPIDHVNKLTAADLIALKLPVRIRDSGPAAICRIAAPIESVRQLIDADLHCGGGLFYETSITAFDQLDALLDRRIQTIVYAGYRDGALLREHVATSTLAGIDRIVPFGSALEFAPVWDGFDLFRMFTRQVSVH